MPRQKNTYLKKIQHLNLPLSSIPGIGSKRAAFCAAKGIHTVLDLLFLIPLRYEDRRRVTPVSKAEEGIPVLVKGNVVFGRENRFYPTRKKMFRISIRDAEAGLELLWFNYRRPYLSKLSEEKELLAYGSITMNRG